MRPTIGPTTSPTKRSIAVQAPPPATWQKFRPQVQSEAIEPISRPSAAATNGSPASGTIEAGGRGNASACVAPAGPGTAAASLTGGTISTRADGLDADGADLVLGRPDVRVADVVRQPADLRLAEVERHPDEAGVNAVRVLRLRLEGATPRDEPQRLAVADPEHRSVLAMDLDE